MRKVAKAKAKWAYESYIEEINKIRHEIEDTYNVNVFGDSGLENMKNLKAVLDSYAKLAGGTKNFNDILHDAMRANDFPGKMGIVFLPGSGLARFKPDGTIDWNNMDSNWNGFHTAAWCSAETERCSRESGNVIFSENMFTTKYQFRDVGFARAPIVGNNLNLAIQLTIAHEFAHVFVDARPESMGLYGGAEEDMANVLATYVVTGGTNMSQSDLSFVNSLQSNGLWDSTWFYPNWP